jgi:hypothetical protein
VDMAWYRYHVRHRSLFLMTFRGLRPLRLPIVLGPLLYDIDDELDLQYYIQRWTSPSSSSSYNDHNHTNVDSPSPEESSNSFITYTSAQTKTSHHTILQQPSRWAMEHTSGMQSTDSSNEALLTDLSPSPNGRIQSQEECPPTRQMLQRLGLLGTILMVMRDWFIRANPGRPKRAQIVTDGESVSIPLCKYGRASHLITLFIF